MWNVKPLAVKASTIGADCECRSTIQFSMIFRVWDSGMVEREERALNMWKKSLAKHKNSSELSCHIIVNYRKACSPKRCEGGHVTVSQTPSPASHLGPWNQYMFQLVKGQLDSRSQQEKGKWQLEQDDCGQYPEAAPQRLGRSIYCLGFGERGRGSSSREIILKCLINSNLVICK